MVASATLLAAPASAQSEPRTAVVRYGDLDLNSSDGVAALDSRVRRAVANVCGVGDSQTLTEIAQSRKCARTAMNEANGRVQFAVAAARSKQGYASNDVTVKTPAR
ncbi:MAG: UrcA family protein [Sphingomonas sp.]|nr:UrcA family protein [Sphingomonas sp.]